jgi:hypothetical protein
VQDTTGAISWVPTATTGTGGTFDFSALTSGDGLKIVDVDGTLDGGKIINVYGGTGTTSVWALGEGGIMTLKGGALIDNAASATVLNLTETTIQATGVLSVYTDASDYMTITTANNTAPVFDSVCGGTAGFGFSDPVTVTYSKTAAADVGTTRVVYGKYALTGSTPVTTASDNMVGARGEFNIATGGVLDFAAGSSFATGVQGKIVASGTTTIGASTSNQDARIQALHGQLDLTGMTINGGMISGLSLDMQVRATAINGAATFDFIHMADANVSKTAQANSFIYAYGEAAFLLDLYDPQANGADWIYGSAHAQASGSTNCLKIRLNGTTYYLALYDSTPGS